MCKWLWIIIQSTCSRRELPAVFSFLNEFMAQYFFCMMKHQKTKILFQQWDFLVFAVCLNFLNNVPHTVHFFLCMNGKIQGYTIFKDPFSNFRFHFLVKSFAWCLIPESLSLSKQFEQHSGLKQNVFQVSAVMFKGIYETFCMCMSKPVIKMYSSCKTLSCPTCCERVCPCICLKGQHHAARYAARIAVSCPLVTFQWRKCLWICVHRCRLYLPPQELFQINRCWMGQSSISSVHGG